MNLYSKFFFASIGFIFSFILFFQYTQALTNIACPDYFFNTDLAKGATSPDVRVIQQILNLDRRTIVAYSGPGSAGNETNYFGVGTREALKRFQALFIEYIGIANGKFGSRTRVSMNAVCKGPFFTGGGGTVYGNGATTTVLKDTIPPIIAVAGPNATDISTAFRAYLKGSEALQTPPLSGLIIENATAGDIRKISSTTFSFLITPNSDAHDNITLQFEANSVSDLAGNTNDNASNEWSIFVNLGSSTVSTSSSIIDIDALLNNLTSATTTDCSTVTSVDVSDYTNPCYGKVPLTNNTNQNQSSEQSQDNSQMIMQLLQGLLKGLTGLGGGGGIADGGGTGAAPGRCACPGPLMGQPTIGLFGLSGPSGRFLETANPGMGNYTGKINVTPPGLCGQMVVQGKCVNPMADSTGAPVMGIIPPAPAFMWGGR